MSGVGRRGWFDPVAFVPVRQTEQMQCGEECIKYQSECVVSNAFACKLLSYIWNLISRLSKFTICCLSPAPHPHSYAH